ncbi:MULTISPECIES: glycosyltransferase family 4 protein [unclassified Methanoregula]|uniref:glycosyltransferase family 4 protein n=1 Tax=unclassified Methanoregula TaxID=2649730 RepID=UPI0009CA7EFB|nr:MULTISPECIES: glycosyltransferase family 4 protein [unclassified Methanoregula]OPX65137.1 MAG: Glycosyl transferases group 1 [Methanoregula sp. PtaB.Bin085]OPY32049.1 MAG: Glycosyl transferases group 1 [Methanoregula sp. PtaU1.Bin006]
MKLAYFSPLPPQKSGISDYSEALLPHLARYFDIDLWVTRTPEKSLAKKFTSINYRNGTTSLSKLSDYPCILFNMGNNPEFHSEMYDVFLQHPGHVILHDFVLYFLVTGYYLDYKRDREGYIREFYQIFGERGIHKVKRILKSKTPPLQFAHPEYFPMIQGIISKAHGIIVHSEYAEKLLVEFGCTPEKIARINQVNYANMRFEYPPRDLARTRKQYGIRPGTLLIASFGYIAPTKRNAEIICAVKRIIQESAPDIQYLMVGEGNYIDGFLDDTIKKTGFVLREDYERLLACSDIVVNLRNPSMGETSATVLQAMTAGKPCIVTDTAWFSELPDGVVEKISPVPLKEEQDLKDTLVKLIHDADRRYRLGCMAHRYVREKHDPKKIAREISLFVNRDLRIHKGDFPTRYIWRYERDLDEVLPSGSESRFAAVYRQAEVERLREFSLMKPARTLFQRIGSFLFQR